MPLTDGSAGKLKRHGESRVTGNVQSIGLFKNDLNGANIACILVKPDTDMLWHLGKSGSYALVVFGVILSLSRQGFDTSP